VRRLLVLALLLVAGAAIAQTAKPLAGDEAVERRLVAIAEELRCLVCQNESLAGSRADLALDLRRQIREQIQAGRSDEEILAYMTDRYGDFIRYRPPLKATTLALWIGPFLLLAVAAGGLAWYVRGRRARVAAPALSPDEEARVAQLLGGTRDDRPA